MTNQDTQILGDEGAALAGASTPSSRSGTRRREPVFLIHPSAPPPVASGDAAAASGFGELTMEIDSRVPVCGGSLFQSNKGTQRDFVSSEPDMGSVWSSLAVGLDDALYAGLADRAYAGIPSTLSGRGGPEIVGPVVELVAVDMIDYGWNVDQIQGMVECINYPVEQNVDSSDSRHHPLTLPMLVDFPDNCAGISGVESIHRVSRFEVMHRANKPPQPTVDEVNFKALPEEFDRDVCLAHEDAVPIGVLAVRLLAEWKLPRIVCRSMAWEEGTPTGAEEDH